METPSVRPWYKKKRYAIPGAGIALLLALNGFSGASTSSPATSVGEQTAAVKQAVEEQTATVKESVSQTGLNDSNLSNHNSYQNTGGIRVHSPAYSTDGNVPNGATAQCNDGTYSFSQHHRGTCSHHGGVAEWL